jgi:hypothetical protein
VACICSDCNRSIDQSINPIAHARAVVLPCAALCCCAEVMIDTVFPLPTKLVWELFFSPDASYSLADFGAEHGESKHQLSGWYVHPNFGQSRDASYEKPLSGPIGPNATRVHKVSRLRSETNMSSFIILVCMRLYVCMFVCLSVHSTAQHVARTAALTRSALALAWCLPLRCPQC